MSDMLTEVRFWAQVIGDAKRTVICSPEMEARCKGFVEARGLAGIITIRAARWMRDDRVYVMDEGAIVADLAEVLARLAKTSESLRTMTGDDVRLAGKREGVELASDYLCALLAQPGEAS